MSSSQTSVMSESGKEGTDYIQANTYITLLKNGFVNCDAPLDFNNKTSLINYLMSMSNRAINNYKLFETLPNKKNMEILNLIHRDMLEKLNELDQISSHSEYHKTNVSEWMAVMHFLGAYGFKEIGDKYTLYSTFSLETRLAHLHDSILQSIDTIKVIGSPKSFHSVENFCTIALRITNSFLDHIDENSITNLYSKTIDNISTEINSLTSIKRKIKPDYCGETISFQKALYEYYRQMIKIKIQQTIINFFYRVLNMRCNNIRVENLSLFGRKVPKSIRQMIQKTSKIMNNINYYIYNCDGPVDTQSNETSNLELKRIMETKIILEEHLSKTQLCDHNCDLEVIDQNINQTHCEEFRDCRHISTHTNSCKPGSGKSDLCDENQHSCGYCICTCMINSQNSTHITTAINFREQVSDIFNNKVVAGVKFSESNNMMHINILESKLHPGMNNLFYGVKIVSETIEYNEEAQNYHIVNENGTVTTLIPGVDYGHPETMFLDDVIAPYGHVITGAKFRIAGDIKEPPVTTGPIQLQIRVTPFDFRKNKLVNLGKTRWITANSANPREEMLLEEPDNPTKSLKNLPDSAPNQFIRFRRTDFRKDAGRSIVPFFDGQMIGRNEPPPLGGIGIYHRGCKGMISANKQLSIRNISSIFNYLKQIESTALNDYKFDSSLSDEKNEKLLDKINTDKVKVFTQLKSMSSEFDETYDESEWADIIAMIGINGFKLKPDYMVPYFFSVGNDIDNLLKKIDSSMVFFKPIGRMSLYNGSVSNFCTYTLPTLDTFFETLRHESLAKLYIKFIGRMVKTEMVSIFTEQIENQINLCGKLMSFNRALWSYYHIMMMGHIKYCVLMYYKWAMDVRCANEPIVYDIKWLDLATEQAQKMMNETKRALKNVNYYVHNCDPTFEELEYGDTEIELKRMIQAVLMDESGLSTTQSCGHRCNLELIGNTVNNTECQELRDCQYIDHDVEICPLEKKSRRYSWFRDSAGNVYGHNKTCENLKLLTSKSKRNDQELCGYCLCTCVTRPSKSVITSVQFTEQDYMIHIQTMEAQFSQSSQMGDDRWKPLENFDYDEATEQYYIINRNGTHIPLLLGVDYARPEIMDLDNVMAPRGYVVTGVRFRFAGDSLEKPKLKTGPIQLQIRVTPFDFIRGKLINLDKTHWIGPQSSIQRREMKLENPNRPTRCRKNNPDSISNQFIEFRASDLRKDAGQSTVPFFDRQIVSFYDTSPFGGLGIYHRGSKKCGGYLAFRAFDFELSKFLYKKLTNTQILCISNSLFKDAKYLYAEYEIINSECGFCLCTCVSKPSKTGNVIAAFSFREQVSDILNNKVITALQFIEKNNMIHIQVMESELMPSGETDLAPWKPLENFIYNEKTEMYYVVHDQSIVTLVPGVDYGHPEIMNLDDVIAPPGHLITGVKWGFAGDSLEKPQMKTGPMQMQVRVTPFDFDQGKLIDLNKTHWITPNSENPRTEMVLERSDNPSEASNNPPDSKTNQFIKFRTTDWCKDFGARTVPFFNGQTVRFLPMTALGGVGIFHKGITGYGGYLALRVFDLNFSKFMNSELI
ncbi:Protein of unknown function [Cotesia congregata]|uniref:Uncharacterized protein n=1 Tax=Cotesia congregata TaxID=51543 RepID=A0A8J2H8A4_COTCN|nr:Protein of unknown function [Cotesia congregata]